jgi:hypothetical protein
VLTAVALFVAPFLLLVVCGTIVPLFSATEEAATGGAGEPPPDAGARETAEA